MAAFILPLYRLSLKTMVEETLSYLQRVKSSTLLQNKHILAFLGLTNSPRNSTDLHYHSKFSSSAEKLIMTQWYYYSVYADFVWEGDLLKFFIQSGAGCPWLY